MRRVLDWGRKLLMLHGSPRGIALGFAIGVAISMVPVPLAGMIVALSLAPLVRASPAATYLGTVVVNPLTAPAFYFAQLWLGAILLGVEIPDRRALAQLDGWGWWALFQDLIGPFGLGAAVMMVAGFALGYPAVLLVVSIWRRRFGSPVLAGAADADEDAQRDHHGEDVGSALAEKRQR